MPDRRDISDDRLEQLASDPLVCADGTTRAIAAELLGRRRAFRARRIGTAAELLAVPQGTVVRSLSGTIAARFDTGRGVVFGDDRPFPWRALSLPGTVLFAPTDGSGVNR